VSGRNFGHRREWILARLKLLAANFAVEICGYSIMGNHLHLVLRTRPDVAAGWSEEEVAARWRALFPKRRDKSGERSGPDDMDVLLLDRDALEKKRGRLSSLSWFMRCLCEWVARRANAEDECSGRFWEGRFKCQALVDDAAVLACSMYVDLNPIRAKLAETPEESDYTSAKDRIDARKARKRPKSRKSRRAKISDAQTEADAWLCPILSEAEVRDRAGTKQTSNVTESPDGSSPTAVRTSAASPSPSFLPMDVDDYLRLLDWTGRRIRAGKRGTIPARLAPILERLAVTDAGILQAVAEFGKSFRRCVGAADTVAAKATSAGKRWFQGIATCRAAFG
jgi:hypothetical protein